MFPKPVGPLCPGVVAPDEVTRPWAPCGKQPLWSVGRRYSVICRSLILVVREGEALFGRLIVISFQCMRKINDFIFVFQILASSHEIFQIVKIIIFKNKKILPITSILPTI